MQKKREEKEQRKKTEKQEKKDSSSDSESSKASTEDIEIPVNKKLAKHLGDDKKFQGWKKTALSLLTAKSSMKMKRTKLIKKVWKVYQ